MMAKLRLLGLLLVFTAVTALGQRPMTVAQVVEFIQSQIDRKGDDRTTADFLHKIKLTEQLDDRTIEELQGKGAGKQTVQALRKLSQESAGLPAAPPPPAPSPPPPQRTPPSPEEQAEILAATRDYALNYVKNLPNYVTIQTTRRRIDPTVRGYRGSGDSIQEQLTFFDGKETYQVRMINGRSVNNVSHLQLGGVVTSGEFGSILQQIFDPDTGSEFRWDHWATLRGKLVYVFVYEVPESHGYRMFDGETKREYTSAYKGFVYADVETKAVMQIQMESVGIPSDYPVREVHLKLDYRPTVIASQEYVLPYHFELDSRTNKANTKNEADYRLYKKFGAETSITFDESEPIPEDQLKEQPDGTQAPAKK
jgi:hypothetical protein